MDNRKCEELECPCCRGKKYLIVSNEAWPNDPPVRMVCIHCDGTGKVQDNMLHAGVKKEGRFT